MNANRAIRAAMVVTIAGMLTSLTVLADEPRGNSWRSGKSLILPPLPPPPKRIDPSEFVPKFGNADRSIEKGQLKLVAVSLELELKQLQFEIELRALEGGGNKAKSEALRREAEIKAVELIQRVRAEAVTARLRECVKREAAARLEVKRLRALPEKPIDGSYRKALETLDDAKIQIENAKEEFVRIEMAHTEEIGELRREAERKNSRSNDPDRKTRTEIDTAEALLKMVRTRLLEIKYGVEDPVLSEATLIIAHLQALRREVKELREQKKP
jgi:hypothetical protein